MSLRFVVVAVFALFFFCPGGPRSLGLWPPTIGPLKKSPIKTSQPKRGQPKMRPKVSSLGTSAQAAVFSNPSYQVLEAGGLYQPPKAEPTEKEPLINSKANSLGLKAKGTEKESPKTDSPDTESPDRVSLETRPTKTIPMEAELSETQSAWQLIFPQKRLNEAHKLLYYQQQLQKLYSQEFGWQLDTKVPIVMASYQNQISNAFAAASPQFWSVFYPGGGYLLDRMATPSWLFVLAVHETTHLYQLNIKKSQTSRFFKKIFRHPHLGTHWQHALWGLALVPNILAPKWLLEGHATYNESRFGRGGRLYSGYVRALVLSALKHNTLTLKNLMNTRLDDYQMGAAYYWGGYLFQHLAEKWPSRSPSQLFYQHSNHPWHLNAAFKKLYNQTYQQIFNSFTKSLKPQADKYQQATNPVLASSWVQSPMHRQSAHKNKQDQGAQNDKILFLTSRLRSHPELNIYDIQTGQLSRQKIKLPLGKVFQNRKGVYQVPAAVTTSATSRQFTLVGPGFKVDKNFYNKIVYDQRAGFTAYIKVPESFDEARLYVSKNNEVYIGPAHSSALLDKHGYVYYFRQHQQQRILYKNKTPLIGFKGFYSFPVDIGPQGEVYFIANTPYGSGLYAYKPYSQHQHKHKHKHKHKYKHKQKQNKQMCATLYKKDGVDVNQVYGVQKHSFDKTPYLCGALMRLHPSDAIIDAKRIGPNDFLVTEVGAKNFEYKIIKSQPRPELPAQYHYTGPQLSIDKIKVATETAKPRPYKPFKMTQLRSVSPLVGYLGGRHWQFQLPVRWADPLNYHQILAQFDFENKPTSLSRLKASNRLNSSHNPVSSNKLDISHNPTYDLSLAYSWLKWPLKSQLLTRFKWQHDNQTTRQWQNALQLQYPLYHKSLFRIDTLAQLTYTFQPVNLDRHNHLSHDGADKNIDNFNKALNNPNHNNPNHLSRAAADKDVDPDQNKNRTKARQKVAQNVESLSAATAAQSQPWSHRYSLLTGLQMTYDLKYPLGWSSYHKYMGLLYHKWQAVDTWTEPSITQPGDDKALTKANQKSTQISNASKNYAASSKSIARPKTTSLKSTDQGANQFYTSIWGGQLQWQHDLGRENIVQLQYQGARAQREVNAIETQTTANLSSPTISLSPEFETLFAHKTQAYRQLSKFSLHYTKAFNQSVYFTSWPLSLRRWAFKGEAYYFMGSFVSSSKGHLPAAKSTQSSQKKPTAHKKPVASAVTQATKTQSLQKAKPQGSSNTIWAQNQHFEFAAGLEFELLFYHKMPARLALLYAQHQQHKKFLMRLSFAL